MIDEPLGKAIAVALILFLLLVGSSVFLIVLGGILGWLH